MFYILNKEGQPLMPSKRYRHIKNLIKSGLAKKISSKPFTVQLLYDCPNGKQNLVLGIDPGRTNIGATVVRDTGEPIFSAQATTRNKDIPKLMAERAIFRKTHRNLGRRKARYRRAKSAGTLSPKGDFERLLPGYSKPITCKGIKNKEARFNNRKVPKGWLTPTANHLLLTHINMIKKFQKFLPITDVVLEANKFSFMEMDNPNIKKWEYSKGVLYGKGSVEDAIYKVQNGHCLFCGNPIVNYHHVVPKHKGGSEILTNRVGLCEMHHHLVHIDEKWTNKLSKIKQGLNKKYGALSVLNQIIPKLTQEVSNMFPEHTFVTDGYSTKAFREDNVIPKDHYFDAYCIACSIISNSVIKLPENPYQIRQFRRHDRRACHKAMLNRNYYLDGKLVATNRHKATEQKTDSLEEYINDDGNVANLIVKEHNPIYKRMDRWMPGSIVNFDGIIDVLQRSDGLHNGVVDYYISVNRVKSSHKKSNILAGNSGLVFL